MQINTENIVTITSIVLGHAKIRTNMLIQTSWRPLVHIIDSYD